MTSLSDEVRQGHHRYRDHAGEEDQFVLREYFATQLAQARVVPRQRTDGGKPRRCDGQTSNENAAKPIGFVAQSLHATHDEIGKYQDRNDIEEIARNLLVLGVKRQQARVVGHRWTESSRLALTKPTVRGKQAKGRESTNQAGVVRSTRKRNVHRLWVLIEAGAESTTGKDSSSRRVRHQLRPSDPSAKFAAY